MVEFQWFKKLAEPLAVRYCPVCGRSSNAALGAVLSELLKRKACSCVTSRLKVVAILSCFIGIIGGGAVWWGISRVNIGYPAVSNVVPKLYKDREARWSKFNPVDFSLDRKLPEHGPAAPADYDAADLLDIAARRCFFKEDYKRAIGMLEFEIRTYREDGLHYEKNPDIENAYLAGAYLHLGQCYQMQGKWDMSIEKYKEALRLYNKVHMKLALYEDAVSGYADVLERIGLISESDRVIEEYRETGKISVQ